MLTHLQFLAIAAFLIWGLVASLCDVLTPTREEARLVSRERGPLGRRD
ncbi:hypothetical protein [Mycobacterium sp. IDR2000157661]|nr:hypothetical protein [Mycobacterium sp. IDR2000157661]ULE31876.1 hypothetical protein K3G64_17035 [Mycobacterium sp. IDR2000157661]